MKKVLILAYDFPPYVSVGGLRPHSWLQNFKQNGIEPIVVTRQWENKFGDSRDYIAPSNSNKTIILENEFGTIISAPHQPNLSQRLLLKHGENKFRLFRKMVTAFYELGQFILPIGQKKTVFNAAKTYLLENNVDLIIATGEPFVLFHYASKLSKSYDTKWVADYRDPWSQSRERKKNVILGWYYQKLEKRALKNVSAVSTVSEYVKSIISPNIPNVPFWIQMNGFNNDHIKPTKQIEQTNDVLSISFAGTIYPWHPIEEVLKSMELFIEKHDQPVLRIRFFGINDENKIRAFIDENCPKLKQSSIFSQKLSDEELVQEIAKDNLLLLFNDYNVLGTKIFNYLGVRRKILLCYSDDSDTKKLKDTYFPYETSTNDEKSLQSEVIEKTNSGEIVKNGVHLIQILEKSEKEFREAGKIECNSNSIEEYTREQQIELFVKFLKTLN